MVSKVQNTSVEKISPAITAPSAVAAKRPAAPASSAMADTVSGGGTAALGSVSEAAPATGENPFAALLTATRDVPAAELRLAAIGDATSQDCEPALAVLTMLAEIESRATAREAWGPSKVRHGYMQVTYDAQEERVVVSELERDASEQLARRLVDRPVTVDAKEIVQGPEWQGAVRSYFKGGDVNAFVQQVLRECYLLGMTDLQLYGDRLKALNELKKKIREEADRARKYKTEWATAAKGDENWVAPYYYGPMEVDTAQMALIDATYTQEELDDIEEQSEILSKEGETEPPAGSTASSFWGGSGLGADEGFVASLADVKGDDIRNVKSTFEKLKTLVPKMSMADIKNWLLPILDNFKRHSHEGGILELMRLMSPEQRLLVAASGFGSDSSAFWYTTSAASKPTDGFNVAERAEYNKLLLEAATALFPGEVEISGEGLTTEQAAALWEKYEAEHTGAVAPAPTQVASNPRLSHQRLGRPDGMVRDDLSGRRDFAVQKSAQTAAPAAAPATGPQVGQRKTIDTVAEMDDYLKYLEEQMNGVGDDAQLANIDLQNCLQKQQQTLQMMSNISKVLHDVTMAIIRNMNS